jgi:glycosyltransferase involved in cell wall biosynthesis
VQAMPIVKKEIPEAHLVIAGREWFYPDTKKSYTDYLKTYISADMKQAIQFLGSLENTQIPMEIEKAEICCYPSHMEAMPLAWVEVMSMGKILVTSNLGPGPEIVKDGSTGILCDPFSPEDIAEKLIYAFKNMEQMHLMGLNARKHSLENFGLNTILAQNISLYNQLISNTRK